jgi:hypothetical protein
MLLEPPLITLRQGIGADKPFGEPNDADLEAPRQLNRGAGTKRDFHAAAADIDHHRASAADIDTIDRRLVDEAGFLRPGDDHCPNAGLTLDPRQELAAIARFTGRTGRDGKNLFDPVRVRKPPEG